MFASEKIQLITNLANAGFLCTCPSVDNPVIGEVYEGPQIQHRENCGAAEKLLELINLGD